MTAHEADVRFIPDDASEIIDGPTPAVGNRHHQMLTVAYILAKNGWPNDPILLLLDRLCDRWDKYPRPFDRWTRLLSMLKAVRKEYPNSPNGTGYTEAEGASS